MEVSIAVEDSYLQSVLGDLTRRRANVLNISSKCDVKVVYFPCGSLKIIHKMFLDISLL